eukprot:Skav203583  [mRNA]  locus=scaffold935:121945:131927:+ [translate_table: standard]
MLLFTEIAERTHVKDSVVIAPYDTGLYVMDCCLTHRHTWRVGGKTCEDGGSQGFNRDLPLPGTLNRSMLPPLNCSAWPRELPVGTLDHLDHLILPNLAADAFKALAQTAAGAKVIIGTVGISTYGEKMNQALGDRPAVRMVVLPMASLHDHEGWWK